MASLDVKSFDYEGTTNAINLAAADGAESIYVEVRVPAVGTIVLVSRTKLNIHEAHNGVIGTADFKDNEVVTVVTKNGETPPLHLEVGNATTEHDTNLSALPKKFKDKMHSKNCATCISDVT